MGEKLILNDDILEKAIKMFENRSFIDNKDSKQLLMNGLCQLDHFKTLMRDPSLCQHLYPFLEEFAQQVTYKPISKGKILFHEGDSVNSLYFVLRGSFVEFQAKSENDIEQEMYWGQQAGQYKSQLSKVQKDQLELQEKKKMQILEMQKIQASQNKYSYGNDSGRGETTTTTQILSNNSLGQTLKSQKQLSNQSEASEQKPQRRGKQKEQQPRKSGSLEESFFTDEFRQKQHKLQSMSQLYQETTKFYQGVEYENLLKIENRYQERYFKNNICLFKKTHVFTAGMGFGELHDSDIFPDAELHSHRKNLSMSTVVCNENSFLLQIPCKTYQRIFGKLTERINFVFHVLANCFPSVKKVILHDFAFQFSEQNLEFNQVLFKEGEVCNFVYIMKGGEIDYRKNINIHGEFTEKRIGMVNQGEIFGHEDLLNQTRSYSVHSCVNNSVVYRIKKEYLLISQFVSPLKQIVKQKAEYLNKRLQELIQRNSEFVQQDDQSQQNQQKNSKQTNSQSKEAFSIHSLDKTGNSIQQMHQGSLRHMETHNKTNNKSTNMMVQSLHNIPSLGHIHINGNLQHKTHHILADPGSNVFSTAKNTNLGENDYHLAFKSLSKLELQQSSSNTKNDDQSKQGSNQQKDQNSKSGKKGQANVLQTTRAQPESIYSRIVRPDSAFKEELDQMKREQAAQLQQFNNNDAYSQTNLQDMTSSSRLLSLNRMNRNGSHTTKHEFKLNKLPKDMFALQMAINSDDKLRKKIMLKTIKQADEQQYDNPRSGSSSPIKGSTSAMNSSQTGINQMPRGTTSSLMRYKEQAKGFFVQDNKPKQLDFFMEFQNYRQEIKAKQLYEKLNRNEVKDDPYAHIDFNVVSNATSTPQSQPNNQQLYPKNSLKQSTSSTSNRNTANNTKSNSIANIGDQIKNMQSINTFKTNNSSYYIVKSQNHLNNNFLMNEEGDESPNNDQQGNSVTNQYNSTSIRPANSIVFEQYSSQSKDQLGSQRSQSRDVLRRSLSNAHNHRKIRFSNQNNVNQYQVNSKISNFNGGQTLKSQNSKKDSFEDSAPIQVRDLLQQQKNLQYNIHNNLIRSDRLQQQQNHQDVQTQYVEAEADLRNNFSHTLSFGGLRKANCLRLGAQLQVIGNRDITLRK